VDKELNTQEQEILLSIARQAIVDQVQTGRYEVEPREEKSLKSRSGCFVSIKQQGKLRGCIGNFQSELPLFTEVAEMAVSSATNDPRFYPMQKAYLQDLQLEI
jgi:AMMECR1 domain-containing protein